jgi:hypothetical protein
MIRAALVAAIGIVLGATATSARAQAQAASPEAALWDHNGSVMYLEEKGAAREFHYQKPRPGMVEVGAHSGSLLFRGRLDNGQYSGTAYIFNPRCGPIPFQVTGSARDNDERIVLAGEAPLVGRKCRIYRTFTSSLEFRRLPPTEAAQSPQPSATPEPAHTPDIKDTKLEAPSPAGGAIPGVPTKPSAVTNENPSPANDPSRNVAERQDAGTPAAEPSVTNKIPSPKDLTPKDLTPKDLENTRSGIVLIVMIAALFSFSLVISLSPNGLRRRRLRRSGSR